MRRVAERWRSWRSRVVLTPRRVVIAMAACGFLLAFLISLSRGLPVLAWVKDSFSYLLGADTFVHGRLSNPTPPFWEHFESSHVLMRPTYASKYPPAQSLFLAAGQALTGYPIVGVWLSSSLMCAAVAWMLLGWVRPKWAAWGTLVVFFLVAALEQGYWLSSYWGGTVAALGGALVHGGARRILLLRSRWSAVLFAVGLGVLVLSRPFEGALVALPAVAAVAWWFVRSESTTLCWRVERVLVPCGLVLGATGAFWLAYNKSVTGHAFRMPYMEYEAQYGVVPIFRFLALPSARTIYQNKEMEMVSQQAVRRANAMHSFEGTARDLAQRMTELRDFLAPGSISVLILLAALSFPFEGLRVAAVGVALVLAASLTVLWYHAHYIAPLIGPWALLLTTGARRLHALSVRKHRTGAVLVALLFAVALVPAAGVPLRFLAARGASRTLWNVQRDSIGKALTAGGQRQLVLVSYGPRHDLNEEWVYNGADIERSQLVWARSLSAAQDAALLSYFHDRIAWRVQVDSGRGPYPLIRAKP